jgi:hypothetical protein
LSLPLARQRGAIRVSPEKHAQIIAALKDNPNASQVARKIGGVSHTKVGKIAKAAGITLAAAESGKRLSANQRAQIIGVLKANPNATQAARKIGVSRTTVSKIVKAVGITLAAPESGKRLSTDQRAQIIGALKANPNASKVAMQIGGVSYAVVWKIAKAAGIELTRGRATRDHRPNKVSR